MFVASWVNPDAELADKTFEDYMREGIYAATEAVMQPDRRRARSTPSATASAAPCSPAPWPTWRRKGDKRIASATFFAAQQDFSEAGDLLLFTNEDWLTELEKKMDAGGGVLSGQTMADTFNALRANDLIWSFFVNNYLMGKEPQAVRPAVLERRPDAHAQDAAPVLSAQVLRRERAGQGRAGAGRREARPRRR